MKVRAVVDTNVFVSALIRPLTGDEDLLALKKFRRTRIVRLSAFLAILGRSRSGE